MLKDTKSLGNNKAPACESRGFVLKKKVCFLTHLLVYCKIIKYRFILLLFLVHLFIDGLYLFQNEIHLTFQTFNFPVNFGYQCIALLRSR